MYILNKNNVKTHVSNIIGHYLTKKDCIALLFTHINQLKKENLITIKMNKNELVEVYSSNIGYVYETKKLVYMIQILYVGDFLIKK